ncbi:MFS transporter [Pigmentiphaga aceris]|uniref:MFS transporter n=1 Tax=Pigmentiphaga aceris TaxID=1940612 RepID=A0A5C0AW34_9BURK|nr:MFS transporter [Pigmentiphaga aceris]QEI06662.1 MFS transporter [Pigmentiphaga aceris]
MTTAQTRSRSAAWLPGLNFFLADVRDGLGPFLGVFLLGHGWQADDIGYVMTIGGIAAMLAIAPMGALIDASRSKRLLLVLSAVLLIAGTMALLLSSSFWVTATSQIGTALVGAIIGPAVMGITLGIVGQDRLAHQLGINEAWNHAGNVASAALAGLAGYYWGLPAVFVLMALMTVGALFCIAKIRPQDIDHDVARGLEVAVVQQGADENSAGIDRAGTGSGSKGNDSTRRDSTGRDSTSGAGENSTVDSHSAKPTTQHTHDKPAASTFRVLTGSAPLQLLAVTMLLFHLGNAAMLPLLGQSIVSQGMADPSAFTAATIIVAQLVMIPMALLAGRLAPKHGYWILVIVALLALPVRGVIAGYWNSPWALIPVQILDGVGAGLMGVALPGLVAQILRGSGHVNVGLGAVMAVQGVGAALSPALAGFLAQHYGYHTAFVALSGVAALGLLVCKLGMSRRGADVRGIPVSP